MENTALQKSLLTALKYAVYTGMGALATFILSQFVPHIGGSYVFLAPIIGGLLKTVISFFATKAAEAKGQIGIQSLNYSAWGVAFMTAVKYALYTAGGALIAVILDTVLPSVGGYYAILIPVFGGLLKSAATYFATKAQEIEGAL